MPFSTMVKEQKVWMVKNRESAKLRLQIIPKTWCRDGYGSLGEREMSCDWA